MSIHRSIRVVLFFGPLLLLVLLIASPYYSVRLTLILSGLPFAHVVPKANLDVLRFVSTDSLRCQAIVFSDGKAVGWIYQPWSGFDRFVPFSGKPSLEDGVDINLWLDFLLPLAWSQRWWLLAAQAGLVLSWFRLKTRNIQRSRP